MVSLRFRVCSDNYRERILAKSRNVLRIFWIESRMERLDGKKSGKVGLGCEIYPKESK